MTPQEFKAWFQGFTEALEGTPSEEQWKRIKARVGEIDGRQITEHVYINRYLPYYSQPYWNGLPYVYCSANTLSVGTNGGMGVGSGTANLQQVGFNSQTAMLALGRAEAQSLN